MEKIAINLLLLWLNYSCTCNPIAISHPSESNLRKKLANISEARFISNWQKKKKNQMKDGLISQLYEEDKYSFKSITEQIA